jgi:multiple sugar transport system permease protein
MTSAAPAGGSLRHQKRTEAIAGYAFIAVPMTLFLIFNIAAIFMTGVISLFDWGVRAGPREFVGLANYEQAWGDPIFWRAMGNTARYALIVVPAQMALGLFLAVIVNQKIRGQTFFRAAFYFPAIASSAAITVLFIYIMNPRGLFNSFREFLGPVDIFGWMGFAANHSWLGHSSTALESIMALNAWTTSGTMMLFYLASLQTISRETYEAAAIDGANPWQTFWRITFPLLKPGHYFVAVVSFIGALQVFDQAYIAGGPDGSPNFALMTAVLLVVRNGVLRVELPLAAAIGMFLFAVIMLITLIQRRLFGQAPSW